MGCLTINDEYGRETIFSTDKDSPALPYIKEYYPKTLKDLQEIGLIPKSANLDHLQAAKDEVLKKHASIQLQIVPPLLSRKVKYPNPEQYAKAYNNTQLAIKLSNSLSNILISRHHYDKQEADHLSRKILSFETTRYQPVFRQIEVAEDLLIHTPLWVDHTIDSILARDIVIYRSGTLIIGGSYLLIMCRSLSGPSLFSKTIAELNTTGGIYGR